MKNKYLSLIVVALIFLIGFTYVGNAQKLGLRIELGTDQGLDSYTPKPLLLSTHFFLKPSPNPEFQFKSMYFYNDINTFPNFGIFVEYRSKGRFTADLGYIYGEGISYSYQFKWLESKSMCPETGNRILTPYSFWYSYQQPIEKFQFSISVSIYNKERRNDSRSTLKVIGGISYIMTGNDALDTISKEPFSYLEVPFSDQFYNETVYTDPYFRIRQTRYYYGGAKNTYSLLLGIHCGFRFRGKERIGVKLYYEQGMKILSHLTYEVWRNEKCFIGAVFTRGSGIHLNLTFPINIWTFSKEKKAIACR